MWDRNRRNMLGTVDDMPQYRKYMTQALELAHKGAGWVNPNPLVGTVVVRDGEILAAGYHDFLFVGNNDVPFISRIDIRRCGSSPMKGNDQ